MTIAVAVFLAVLFLAYANGANDNFKGVATLFGSGTADYRRALAWGTGTTLAGSLAALWIGHRLIATFSGKGLVSDAVAADPAFLAATGFGAAGTVFLATRLGFPISTTHGLVGGLVGAGLASGQGVSLAALGGNFIVPLLVSPWIALALTAAVYPVFQQGRLASGITRETCVCVGEEVRVVAAEGAGVCASAVQGGSVSWSVDAPRECFERYNGRLLGVSAQSVLDRFHFLSAGAVGFARGLNDTPKIVALLLVVQSLSPGLGIFLVGLAMAAGGILQARRVARTMSLQITPMNHGQGFTANAVSAGLVLFASRWGMPVSTTHVTCGALFGIGSITGKARWGTVGRILASWVTTLPVAALLAAAAYLWL